MSSRPQFSLRMLLFVMAMVCLAAATVTDVPENQRLARNAQIALSVVMCFVFPAMFIAGAVTSRGYAKTMFIGALCPALAPLAMLGVDAYLCHDPSQEVISEWLDSFRPALEHLRREVAIMWAMVPCASFASLCFDWLLGLSEGQNRARATLSRMYFAIRPALFGAVTVSAMAASIWPDQWPRYLNELQTPMPLPTAVQALLRPTLSVVFPACLAAGAVLARSNLRTFCIGSAVPAVVAMALMCFRAAFNVSSTTPPINWSWQLAVFVLPASMVAALWIFAPVFGLVCVFSGWLFTKYGPRVLLFVLMVVCLATAAVTDLPEEQTLARNVLTAQSIALSVLLPALLIAGAVAARGYAKTLFIGALFPALAPLVIEWIESSISLGDPYMGVSWWLTHLGGLWYDRRLFAIIWTMVPGSSCVCLVSHWLWRTGERRPKNTMPATPLVVRAEFFGLVGIFVATASIWPDQWPRYPFLGPVSWLTAAQGLLRTALTVIFPAGLTVGAIHSRRSFRAFCIGGAAASSVAMVVMCLRATGNSGSFRAADDWSSQLPLLVLPGPVAAALWAIAPLFGLMCVFIYWLFQRGEADERTGDA